MTFEDYTVYVTTEPSYYGSDCSPFDAARIAEKLADMIHREFPGITILRGEGRTTGPDTATTEVIHAWIEKHWTAALRPRENSLTSTCRPWEGLPSCPQADQVRAAARP